MVDVLSILKEKIQSAEERMEQADRNNDAAGTTTWRNRLDALIDVRRDIAEAIGDVVV